MTEDTHHTPTAPAEEPGGCAAVSTRLRAAGGDVTQLLDLLTEGLLVDRQLEQLAGRIPRRPGTEPSERGER